MITKASQYFSIKERVSRYLVPVALLSKCLGDGSHRVNFICTCVTEDFG